MNNFFHPRFSLVALTAVLGLWTATPLYAFLATDTWNGGGVNNNWSTGANWVGGVPPGAVDNLHFAGTVRLSNTNDLGINFPVSSIFFDSGAGAFTLNGGAIFFAGIAGELDVIQNNSVNTQTLNFANAGGGLSGAAGIFTFTPISVNATSGNIVINPNIELDNFIASPTVMLTFNNANNITVNGVIFDNGAFASSVTYNGSGGTLFLNANNFFGGFDGFGFGTFTENGGTVVVGSQFSLGLGNTTINFGTLETAGGLPLIFNVGHNFTMIGGFPLAILQMKVGGLTPGFSADFLHVGNVMNLSGELFVHKIFNYLPAPGDQVTIITSGGARNGTFQFVTSDFPGLIQPIAVYFPQRVDVRFVLNPFTSLAGLCDNEFAVAEALDRAFAGACLPLSTFTFLGNEPIADLPRDLQLIAPEELAAMYEIKFSQATVENSNLMRRMDEIRAGSNGFCAAGYVPPPAPTYSKESGGKGTIEKNPAPAWVPSPENRWGIFITGGGDFVHVGNNDECAAGYDLRIGDLTVGADYRILPNLAIGIYGGYDGAEADLASDGRLDMASGKGGGFITAFWHGFYADAAGGGGWDNYEIHRRALSPRGILGLTQGAFANGSTDGDEVNAMGALGYDWKHDFGKPGCIVLGPLLSVQYTNVNINGYTEHGSLIPLEIPDQSDDSLRLTAGGRVSMDIPSEHGVIFRPEARASWLHEFNDRAYPIEARFVGCPDLFTVRGPEVGRDAALVGAGVTIQVTPTFSVFGHYDGIVSRHNYNSYAVNGGLGFSF